MVGRMRVAALLAVCVAIVGYITPAVAQACSNGLAGVESTSYDVCCSVECTTCGGSGCALQNTTNGAADCCVTEIYDSGVLCSESGAAPCIITTAAASNDSVCDNGMTGVQDPNTDVCCPLVCGNECGGDGCGTIPGATADQCCAANVTASGVLCSESGEPPCLITAEESTSNSTCSNGLPGIMDSLEMVCCVLECGMCGGDGCGNVVGLSSEDCCSSVIETSGESCNVTGSAPCILPSPEYTPSMCPNGIAGVQDGSVCCAEECNLQCGGEGCGTIPGTNGESDCCSTTILESGVYCEDGVSSPCIMINGTYPEATEAPLFGTPAPSVPTTSDTVDSFSFAPTMGPTASSRGGIGFGTDAPTMAPSLTIAPTESTDDDFVGSTESPTPAPTSAAPPRAQYATIMTAIALVAGAVVAHAAVRH